jgi:PGM1 C-terminal domain/Pre ATP-grasp domain
MAETFDAVAFARLQDQLVPMWPAMTLRRREEERTLMVVSSVSADVPAEVHPLLAAYEERYLIFVLGLVRQPNTRVVYVTSQPVLPRMLDYYLELVGGVDREELRSRLVAVSVGDWSPRPLSEKILERPRLLERLRSLVPNRQRAVLLPFVTTVLEARLAVELGIPVYGPHPALGHLGTKTGSREVFAAAGIAHPRGAEGMRSVADVADAVEAMRPDGLPDEAIVKLDDAFSGFGNALVDLLGAEDRAEIERRVRRLRPEHDSLDADEFLGKLEGEGGIVEERISGAGFRSPSVQLRASPEGGVELLSTHDQLLGGPNGQTYFGCRFPAAPDYATTIAEYGYAIAEELSRRGVIGRFAVDFVATQRRDVWSVHAVEINLRNGGTTHPALALLALTEGDYDPASGRFLADGVAKHYVATDHLELPQLRSLTPDDVLDLVADSGLGWDESTQTGSVFHMVSAVAVSGRVGVTCIANDDAGADALYDKTVAVLAAATQT